MIQQAKKNQRRNKTLPKVDNQLLSREYVDKFISNVAPYKEFNRFFNFSFDFLPDYYQDTIVILRGMLVDIHLVENQDWKFERIYLSKTQAPSIKILKYIDDLMESFNIELKEWDLKRLCSIKEQVWVLRNSTEYNKGVAQIYANKKKEATKKDLIARDLDIIDKLIRENPDITQEKILEEIRKELGINLTRGSIIFRDYLAEYIERKRKSIKAEQAHPLFRLSQSNTYKQSLAIAQSPLFKKMSEFNKVFQSAHDLMTPSIKLIKSAPVLHNNKLLSLLCNNPQMQKWQEITNKIHNRYNSNQKIEENLAAIESQTKGEQVECNEDKTR